ncbi:hypothetical protein M6D81_08255 [Paenibacillus sp. J5C_2022]|nr:hypothetical protein [Paenibacillus sp. J5C2022]
MHTPVRTPNPSPSPTPASEPPNYLNQPQSMDDSLYKEEEREIVKVLNKMMKATLESDVNSCKNVQTKEHNHQKDTRNYLSLFNLNYETHKINY